MVADGGHGTCPACSLCRSPPSGRLRPRGMTFVATVRQMSATRALRLTIRKSSAAIGLIGLCPNLPKGAVQGRGNYANPQLGGDAAGIW